MEIKPEVSTSKRLKIVLGRELMGEGLEVKSLNSTKGKKGDLQLENRDVWSYQGGRIESPSLV